MILPMTMPRREFCNWYRPVPALTLITYATRQRVACRFHGLARKKLRRQNPRLRRLLKTGFLPVPSGARPMRAATRKPLPNALSRHFRARAFAHYCNMPVTRIIRSNGQVRGVLSAERRFDADAVIVAAGVQTRDLLAPLGIKLPIYGVKGYSITVPLDKGAPAPEISLTDLKNRLVFSRLGDRLRVAGFAEIGARADIAPARVAAMRARVGELFPRPAAG